MDQFLIELFTEPELSHKIIEVSTKTCIEYASENEKAGADIITLGDIPSSDLISLTDHDSFSKPYNERIIKSSKIPFILHICGDSTLMLDSMVSSGARAVSIDAKVDMAVLKRVAAGKCATAGNVSVINSLLNGTPEDVAEETRMAISKGADLPCGSCGFVPGTSTSNLRAMVSAIRKYGEKN